MELERDKQYEEYGVAITGEQYVRIFFIHFLAKFRGNLALKCPARRSLDDHRLDSGIACTQIDGKSGKASKYLPKWDPSCHFPFFDRNLSKYFCRREREGIEESTFAQYFQRRTRRRLNAPAPHTHTFFYLPFLHSIKFIYGTKTDVWSPSGPVSAPVTHVSTLPSHMSRPPSCGAAGPAGKW